MNDMPDPTFYRFVDVFKKFPQYEFIWKFDRNMSNERKNILTKKVKNIHSKDWIKQVALLGMFYFIMLQCHEINRIDTAENSPN